MKRNPTQNKSHQKGAGKLRIIGGEWRSRQLPVVDLPGLRPTTDRVRETLFNWLQNDIPGARCLDLFAGSGALGFEAASRGAASVTMLELQNNAAQVLSSNMQLLGASNVHLVKQDALSWLSSYDGETFDVVFIDPPFESDLMQRTIEVLESCNCLAVNASIYLETASNQFLPELPESWNLLKKKKAGQVSYYLARYDQES